jgi:putative PEP-CTERM system TPR-repeat lipoprotein
MRSRFAALVAPLAALCWLTACDSLVSNAERLQRAQQSAADGDFRAALVDLKILLQKEPDNATARVELGKVSLQLGDPDGAIRELEYARRLGSPSEAVALTLAQAYMFKRNHAAALDCLDQAGFTTDADRKEALRIRGGALLDLRRAAEAKAAFEQALSIDERFLPAMLGLAAARFEVGGLEQARATLDAATAKFGTDPQIGLMWGSVLMRDQRFSDAKQAFRGVLATDTAKLTDPIRALALAGTAESEMALGDTGAALVVTDDLLKLAPHSSSVQLLRARALFLGESYEESRNLLQELVAADPTNSRAQLLLGAVNYVQGNLGQADMHFTSVLAVEPGNGFARKLLADTRLRQQKPRDALSVLGPAISSGDQQTLELAARASAESGDLDAGLAYLEQGLTAHPEDTRLALQLAAGYIASGKLQRAVDLLDKLPEEGDAAYRREVLLTAAKLRSGNVPEALRLGQRLVASHPTDALARAMLGGLLVARGDLSEARVHFVRAVELDPRNTAALVNLGKLELLEGNFDAAERQLRAALELSPKSPATLVALAQLELARGKPQAATAWLETARERNQRAAEPRVLLAQYHLARRELDQAEALAREALEVAPANTGALNVLALTLSAAGRHEEGIATLQKVASETPRSATVQFSLARALLAQGQTKEALGAAEKSLESNAEHVTSLAFTGAVALEAGDIARARVLLERLAKLAPGDPATLTLTGDIALRERDFVAAANAYRRAAELKPSQALALREFFARKSAKQRDAVVPLLAWLGRQPDDRRARLVLAQEQQASGDETAAADNYAAILRTDPNDAAALNNLAWLYFSSEPRKAQELARRAHELRPEDAAIADTYGWVLLANGDHDGAVKVLGTAVQRAPQSPDLQYHYAAALARAGKSQEARSRLEALLRTNAAFGARAEAQELLKTLSKSAT